MTDQQNFYSKKYSMTIEEAQLKRQELAEYKAELETFANDRVDLKSKSDLIRNTKDQKARKNWISKLHEELADAPPEPMTPDEILKYAFHKLYQWRDDYEEDMAAFVKNVRNDPMHALEWNGDDIIKAQVYHGYAKHTIEQMEKCDSKAAGVRTGFGLVAELKKELTTDVLNQARWGVNRSSGFRGIVELHKYQAQANLLEDLKWICFDTDRMLDALTSWELLNS